MTENTDYKAVKQGTKKNNGIYIILFWLVVLIPIVLISILFYMISTGNLGFMPSFEELENPKSNLASEIYSSDQQLLGKFYIENRTFVRFDDLSPHLVNALIATEDCRYNEHSGIDFIALGRVLRGLFAGGSGGGGSTITQQLAKNLFPRDTTDYESNLLKYYNLVITKFKEWVTAVKLEHNYTKEEIIVMYLNTVPYGHQTFGIKSAARTFFDVSPDSLKVEEAGLLIGLLKAPTFYSPLRNPERCFERRGTVLSQMYKYEYMDQATYDSIKLIPIQLKYTVQDHKQGKATYFREYLRTLLTAKQSDDSVAWRDHPLYGWCNKHLKPDSTPYNLYKDGLKIYTTINSRMQEYAENAMKKHMGEYLQKEFFKEQKGRSKAPFAWDIPENQIESYMERYAMQSERYRKYKIGGLKHDSIMSYFHTPVSMKIFSWEGEIDTILTPFDSIRYYKHLLHAGFMSFEPQTGYVRAYVGGIDYKHFQYDHVVLSKRQVGSTFKPFLYTLAMEEKLSPCYEVPNIPTVFEMPEGQPDWSPHNAGKTIKDGEMVTLQWGLANSVNFISAWLMKRYNPASVIKKARKMGITSPIDQVPSICLGTPEISVYEMVGAYGTFVNMGVFVKPMFVTRIEDKNGNVLQSFTPEMQEAFSEETAYLMVQLLEGVIRNGTSVRLWLPSYPYHLTNAIAAKTGTTDDYSDGWFIGMTPNLVSGGWVGGDERHIHFRGMALGQGATMALPIWAWYMKSVYADSTLGYLPSDTFEKPSKGTSVILDCKKYKKTSKLDFEKGSFEDESE